MENREILNGWRETTLGEVAEIIDSLHKTPVYNEIGYPMVRVTDIKRGMLSLEKCLKVSKEVYLEFSKKYKAEKGDIVFSRVGSEGIAALVNHHEEFCLGQNTVFISPYIKDKYIYYWLGSPQAFEEITSKTTGTTQRTISLKSIKELRLIYPDSKEERYTIGQIFSSLDEKIELLEEENKTLETLAQTIFTEWFVNFNFPGATGEMEDSDLGEIPKGWRVGKLGEILTRIESGRRPKGGIDSNLKLGIPSVGAENINGIGKYNYASTKFIEEEFYNSMKNGKVENYDVLIYKDGAYIGRKAMFGNSFPFEKFAINEHVFILRVCDEIGQFYLYFSLVQEKLAQLNTNSA